MFAKLKSIPILLLCALSLTACATAPHIESSLEQGQRLFEQGNYKRSLENLLPLASKGYPQAQYAVGYMYYYGYGIERDVEAGEFWIKRAADQGYLPAKEALNLLKK